MWLWPKFVSMLESRVTKMRDFAFPYFFNPSYFFYSNFFSGDKAHDIFIHQRRVAHTKSYTRRYIEKQYRTISFLQWYSTRKHYVQLRAKIKVPTMSGAAPRRRTQGCCMHDVHAWCVRIPSDRNQLENGHKVIKNMCQNIYVTRSIQTIKFMKLKAR